MTRLHYNRFRYYDPGIGRYISADPIGQAGGVNVYEYGFNNPLSYVDPSGQNPAAVAAVVGGVIGAVAGGIGAANAPGADATTIAVGAAVGFVAGAASVFSFGVTNPFVAGAVAGGAAGGAGNLASQALTAGLSDDGLASFDPDLESAANACLAGGVGGTVGAAFGPAGFGLASQAGVAGSTAAFLEAAANGSF